MDVGFMPRADRLFTLPPRFARYHISTMRTHRCVSSCSDFARGFMRQSSVRRHHPLAPPYEFSRHRGQRTTPPLDGLRFYTDERSTFRIEDLIQTLECMSFIGRRVSNSPFHRYPPRPHSSEDAGSHFGMNLLLVQWRCSSLCTMGIILVCSVPSLFHSRHVTDFLSIPTPW